MANEDYTLVRLDDNIADGAVLTYDGARDMITDSGMIASQGELQAAAGTVSVGLQDMSSTGEQVVWRNQVSGVGYVPPWHVIDEINPGGSYDRLYEPMQTATRFSDRSSVLENPSFQVHVPVNEVVFSLNISFVEANHDVVLEVLSAGKQMWREVISTNQGPADYVLQEPIAFHPGDYIFQVRPYGDINLETPIKVMGNSATGEMGYDVTFRPFREVPLATREYVDAAVTGAPASDIMTKAVYDTDNDGKVDEAAHADKATTLDGGPSASNNQFYGKDSTGVLGFHTVAPSGDIPDTANKVYVKEFTTATYTLSSKELDTDRVPYYIYTGTVKSAFNLPHLSNMDPESITFGVLNNSNEKLTVNLRSGDGWNGDDTIKAYEMAPKTGVVLVSDLAQTTWYVVATMDVGHFTEFTNHLLIIEAELKKHETALDAHGVTLANHASQIRGADSTANSAMTLAQQNAETIVTNRKNAIKGVTVEQDASAKTITLKFIADSGIVDTGVIDLSTWFTGGTNPPSTDHKIYYGFASRMPLSESDVLRSGTPKTVPTVAGLDIDITRTSQSPSFIYVWLPDSVGTIKGFTFSGFLSTWGSTALSIAGSPGKLYSSPNKTSATNINFEVTQ